MERGHLLVCLGVVLCLSASLVDARRFTYADFCDWPHLVTAEAHSNAGIGKIGTNLALTQYGKPNQLNALWGPSDMNITHGFIAQFTFATNKHSSNKAEGFAFVLAPPHVNNYGYGAENLGYGGIKGSLALEFDVEQNPNMMDPNDNHISWHGQGAYANDAAEVEPVGISGCRTTSNKWYSTDVPNLADGNVHTVEIDFDAEEGIIQVSIDKASIKRPQLICDIDINDALGLHPDATPVVNMGFTATNGEEDSMDMMLHNWKVETGYKLLECVEGFTGDYCLPAPSISNQCHVFEECDVCVFKPRTCCGWQPSTLTCEKTTTNCPTPPAGAHPCPVLYCTGSQPQYGGGNPDAAIIVLSTLAGVAVLVGAVMIHVVRRRRASGLSTTWKFWTWSGTPPPLASAAPQRLDYSNLGQE